MKKTFIIILLIQSLLIVTLGFFGITQRIAAQQSTEIATMEAKKAQENASRARQVEQELGECRLLNVQSHK